MTKSKIMKINLIEGKEKRNYFEKYRVNVVLSIKDAIISGPQAITFLAYFKDHNVANIQLFTKGFQKARLWCDGEDNTSSRARRK